MLAQLAEEGDAAAVRGHEESQRLQREREERSRKQTRNEFQPHAQSAYRYVAQPVRDIVAEREAAARMKLASLRWELQQQLDALQSAHDDLSQRGEVYHAKLLSDRIAQMQSVMAESNTPLF